MAYNEKFLGIAKTIAELSTGVGGSKHCNFRIGAVIVRKNNIVSTGYNSYKTSPRLVNKYKWPFYHAESRAILRVGFEASHGCDMYIVRILRNNQEAIACPCGECISMINLARIENVYYSTEDGHGQL